MNYRESSNLAKSVREGIVEPRPVSCSRTEKPKDWLAIYQAFSFLGTQHIRSGKKIWRVWDEYVSEEVARAAFKNRSVVNWYVVRRDIYEAYYKEQRHQ